MRNTPLKAPVHRDDEEFWKWQMGDQISLRDYFAGQALGELVRAGITGEVDDFTPIQVAKTAYNFADAMLKAREKGDG